MSSDMQRTTMSANSQTRILRRVFGTVIWGAWVVALVAVLLSLFSSREEMRGNLAFSFIVASVLVVLTMIPALMIGARTRDASRICWITLSAAVIVFTGYVAGLDHPEARSDAGTFFAIAMTALTFPLGLAALALGAAVSKLLPESSMQFQILMWSVVFVGVGYIQWWRIVPTVLRRFASRASPDADAVAPGNSS
jgi:uncharacterized membrane protein YhaH (DUF805 family)